MTGVSAVPDTVTIIVRNIDGVTMHGPKTYSTAEAFRHLEREVPAFEIDNVRRAYTLMFGTYRRTPGSLMVGELYKWDSDPPDRTFELTAVKIIVDSDGDPYPALVSDSDCPSLCDSGPDSEVDFLSDLLGALRLRRWPAH